jgi:hypothetical protein
MDLRPGYGQRSGTSRERGGPAPLGAPKTANPSPSGGLPRSVCSRLALALCETEARHSTAAR